MSRNQTKNLLLPPEQQGRKATLIFTGEFLFSVKLCNLCNSVGWIQYKQSSMNDLEKYFRQNNKKLIHKWIHYFDVYDRHFSRFRDKEMTILEIGISQGGSLQMWKDYFGPKAKIYGIDVNPQCKALEEENIKIFIGSQSDRNFLREIKKSIPQVDILLDDGGHTMRQQIVTFEELFGHIKENGVYLCEDMMTSYWMKYGGGVKRRGTFIEYTKNFIDFLNFCILY